MAIKVRQMLVSSSKYSIKCPYSMDAEYITVHNTANDASANSEVKYMVGNNNEVSFHFAVDDKEVVQGLPVNRNAWHTGDSSKGDGNRKSIGVEICYSKSGGELYKKAEALSIKFVAQLLKERGWGIDRVRTHKSWTEIGFKKGYSNYVKNCPHRILDESRWDEFLDAVQAELNGSSKPVVKKVVEKVKRVVKKVVTPVNRPILQDGDKGQQVKDLQYLLIKKGGYNLVVDGEFGKKTTDSVKDFQKKNKLTSDGVVGDKTWAKLV